MRVTRETLIGLLRKIGIEPPEEMSTARMVSKIQHLVYKKGLPKNLTQEEADGLKMLGFTTAVATEAPAKTARATVKVPEREPEPDDKADIREEVEDKPEKKMTAVKVFASLMRENKRILKEDLVARLKRETGVKTAGSYVSYAKSSGVGGVRVRVEKDQEGNAWVILDSETE